MALSHLDQDGRARMVDVGDKAVTARAATAEGEIRMSPEAFRLVADQAVAKGDVLTVAQVAGTMAAKRTADLIPLCHPIGLEHVAVETRLDDTLPGVRVRASVRLQAARRFSRPAAGRRAPHPRPRSAPRPSLPTANRRP